MSDSSTIRERVRVTGAFHHVETEVIEEFDRQVAAGRDHNEAAWIALYEWDCIPPEQLLVGRVWREASDGE